VDNELVGIVSRLAPGSALVTLVTLAVLAVWRGWLVPRRTVDSLLTAARQIADVQEKRLAESIAREQEWRAAWDAERRAREVLDGHVGDVVDSLATVERLIRAIPGRKDGGQP
jgi:hypothetical protein